MAPAKRNRALLSDAISTILKAYTTAEVRLEGYTDSQGADAANLRLSQSRVTTVSDLLAERGVEAARISGEGRGEARPVGDNATEEGRAMNRRLELTVTKK